MLLVEIINHRIMTIRIQDVGCQRKYQKANHVWMDMNGVSRIKKTWIFMLLFHSWVRFVCEICPQIISVSMVFIMKHFIQPHLEGRTCECTSSFTCTKSSMSWDVVDSFGRTLREEICNGTFVKRKDLSKDLSKKRFVKGVSDVPLLQDFCSNILYKTSLRR